MTSITCTLSGDLPIADVSKSGLKRVRRRVNSLSDDRGPEDYAEVPTVQLPRQRATRCRIRDTPMHFGTATKP